MDFEHPEWMLEELVSMGIAVARECDADREIGLLSETAAPEEAANPADCDSKPDIGSEQVKDRPMADP